MPKSEVILLQKETMNGLRMALIIQYECQKDNIWCCHFGGKKPETLVKDPNKTVLPLKIQAGPNNTCYFV